MNREEDFLLSRSRKSLIQTMKEPKKVLSKKTFLCSYPFLELLLLFRFFL
jgi:hypothetical protein